MDLVKYLNDLYKDGFLSADFALFGVPQTRDAAEIFLSKYQKIRNTLTQAR